MTQQPPKITPVQSAKPWYRKVLKGLGLFFAVWLFVFFAATLLIQTNKVQNWLIDKVTYYLSDKLQTVVQVGEINIDFFDQMVLKDFYVEDYHCDTLLYSTQLKINLNTSLANIFQKNITITDVTLDNPQFRLTRYEGEERDQFKMVLDQLISKSSKAASEGDNSKPLFLDVGTVTINKAIFIKKDIVGGEILRIALEKGVLLVDSLNLVEKNVTINKAILTKPHATLLNYPKQPLPIDTANTTTIFLEVPNNRPKVVVVDTAKKWLIHTHQLQLTDGFFRHHNYRKAPVKKTPKNVIDFNHISVADINIELANFRIQDWVFEGTSEHFSLRESTGFVLDNLIAKQGRITPTGVELRGMELTTPFSNLKDSLIFKFKEYADFKDFPNKVRLEGHFNKASIALKDIIHFAPNLKKNQFFAQNKNEILYIDGILSGKINSLRGKNLRLNLGNVVRLNGNFGTYNLTDNKETFLRMDLKQLRTQMTTLRSLFPNMTLPSNFDKLGELNFKGDFVGFFSNFVANGFLKTNLGDVRIDMQTDWRKGRELATYKGGLDLINFDLAKWADNDDFGIVTLNSTVKNGKGLTLAAADATLNTTVAQFHYKGYTYENLTLNGHLNQNNFEGKFSVEDDNIAFDFEGEIANINDYPEYVFEARLKKLDAKSLNLMQQDVVFSGDLDITLSGKTLNDLQGIANFKNIAIVKNGTENYTIDSLEAIYATTAITRDKSWTFTSEILDASIVGDFDITKVKEAIFQFIEKNYPPIANRFGIKGKRTTNFVNNQFDLELNIHDTKNLTYLLDEKLDTIQNASLAFNFNYLSDSFLVDVALPVLKYDNLEFKGIQLKSNGLREKSNLDFQIASSNFNNQLQLAPVTILSWIDNDSIAFSINTKDFENVSDRLNLRGEISLIGDLFNFRFLKEDLVILNDEWTIADDNYLQIGTNHIKTNNFELSRGSRSVALTTIDEKGLNLEVDGFNTSYINEIWSYQNLQFDGIYNINATVRDLFKMEEVSIAAQVDSFYINDDPYGLLKLDVSTATLKSPIALEISTTYGERQMTGKGIINPPSLVAKDELESSQPKYLSVQFDINKYPLKIAEYFVTSGITGTEGDIEAKLIFDGLLPKPNIDGVINVTDGKTSIDYTGTTYYFENETALMNNEYLLDVTGSIIYDEFGNSASVYGGITHDFFKNLGLDVQVLSDQFLVIDTREEDNDIYYGTGIAGGRIEFSGDFQQTNIEINATTRKGSTIYIPVSSGSKVEETSFIRFITPEKEGVEADSVKNLLPPEIKGVKLDIELAMTNAAEVQLIFDKQAGDIMKGTGFGNINFEMTREGEISMYGHYEVESGSYLFTLFNLVNKPFAVKSGGTIDWTGDPYNAIINIEAEYADLFTTPYNFILEYLNDENVRQEARQSTNVELTMKLTDQLLKPTIAFELDFPNLIGEIKNYTDSKIRAIQLDKNELNRQVFGLIVIGSFLPSEQGGLQGRELLTGINTLSELLSNQLSIYLTDFISNAVNGSFFSLEDFDVAYSVYEASFIENPNEIATGHGVHLRQRFRIKDRWVVKTSQDFDLGGSYIANDENLVTGDVILEYELTRDRRLKIRGYYKNEPEIFGGRRNNAGLGLSFRREFDSLDLLSFLKKSSKDLPADTADIDSGN